eukprot:scaffold5387_cov251-Ochromonas_danica.AAC.13
MSAEAKLKRKGNSPEKGPLGLQDRMSAIIVLRVRCSTVKPLTCPSKPPHCFQLKGLFLWQQTNIRTITQ